MRTPLYVLSWRTSLEPISRLEQTQDRQPQLSPQVRHRPSESDSHANYERCRYSPASQVCARRRCSARRAAFPPMRETGRCSQRMRKNVWRLFLISYAWWKQWKACLALLRSLCSTSPQSGYPSLQLNENSYTPYHLQFLPVGNATYIILPGPQPFPNRPPRLLPPRYPRRRRRQRHHLQMVDQRQPRTSPSVLDRDSSPPRCHVPVVLATAAAATRYERRAAPPSAMMRRSRHCHRRLRSPPALQKTRDPSGT